MEWVHYLTDSEHCVNRQFFFSLTEPSNAQVTFILFLNAIFVLQNTICVMHLKVVNAKVSYFNFIHFLNLQCFFYKFAYCENITQLIIKEKISRKYIAFKN